MGFQPPKRFTLDEGLNFYFKGSLSFNFFPDDPRLIPYNYENLHAHLKKFMFYGAMISINFLPWMLCTPDECQKLTHLWFTNMDSVEFTHITTTCGGKETNERLMEIIRMAHRLNHLDIITK